MVALEESSTNYKDIISKANAENAEGDEVFRADMDWKEAELNLDNVAFDASRFLVVGFACRKDPTHINLGVGNKDSKLDKKFVGNKKPSNTIQWDESEPPLLVATPVTSENPDAVKLYALLTPSTECEGKTLCKPYNIAQKDVFYRSGYRDRETAQEKRKTSWNKNVLRDSVRPGYGERGATKKQNLFKRARGEYPAIMTPNQSLANEAVMLAEMFSHTKDIYFLELLKKIFEALDSELSDEPRKNRSMRKFIRIRDDFTDKDVADFVFEITEQYENDPKFDDINEDRVRILSQGLKDGKVKLPYRMLPSFIKVGTHLLAKKKEAMTPAQIKDLVIDVAETVMRCWPEPHAMPSLTGSPETALLQSIRNRVREMDRAGMSIEENFLGPSEILL